MLEYPFHNAASIFPMMSPAELEALADDIRAHGLREPIWVHQGAIIDGRNRYRACQRAGVQPRFREWDGKGSLVVFVVSLNLHRRHLTESQRAMVAARIKPMFEAEANERRRSNLRQGTASPEVANLPPREYGHSRDKAAEAVNVSPRTVESASRVLEHGVPELVEAVDRGEVSVSAAAQVAAAPAEIQRAAVAGGRRQIIETAKGLSRRCIRCKRPIPVETYRVSERTGEAVGRCPGCEQKRAEEYAAEAARRVEEASEEIHQCEAIIYPAWGPETRCVAMKTAPVHGRWLCHAHEADYGTPPPPRKAASKITTHVGLLVAQLEVLAALAVEISTADNRGPSWFVEQAEAAISRCKQLEKDHPREAEEAAREIRRRKAG